MEILFLAPRPPWPTDTGAKIRTFHLLEALARAHEVTCATFIDGPEDAAAAEALRAKVPLRHLELGPPDRHPEGLGEGPRAVLKGPEEPGAKGDGHGEFFGQFTVQCLLWRLAGLNFAARQFPLPSNGVRCPSARGHDAGGGRQGVDDGGGDDERWRESGHTCRPTTSTRAGATPPPAHDGFGGFSAQPGFRSHHLRLVLRRAFSLVPSLSPSRGPVPPATG